MTDWNISFSPVVNPTLLQNCNMRPGEVMAWCKDQYVQHSYIYMPVMYCGFFLLAGAYLLMKYHKKEYIMLGNKKISCLFVVYSLLQASVFLLGSFICIYLIQNDIRPFSWLPVSWKIWLKGVLGI